MISQLIKRNKSYDISFYTLVQTSTNGVLNDPTWALYKTVKGLYWKATGSKNNISEKFKEQISACIIVNPADISESEIATDMKITVSGEGDYRLVYADNIAAQNKVLQINVKEWA